MNENRPGPDLILPRRLLHWARLQPHQTALRQKEFGLWRAHDWADYARMARGFARGLMDLGMAAGEHVAILSESRREWVVAQLGTNLAGGVVVGIYPTSPAAEIDDLMARADVAWLVCEDQEQYDKALEIRHNLPGLRGIMVIEARGVLRRREITEGVHDFTEVMEAGARADATDPSALDARLAPLTPDDPALMVFTSGSTGRPKAAILSYRNISAAGDGVAQAWNLRESDSVVSYLPLCHVAEQVFTVQLPLAVGYTVNFAESLRTVQSDLREIGPSVFLGVPRIWEKMNASISIKIMETGRLRRAVFERAMATLRPLASKPRGRWSLGERLQYGFWYVLILRALLNFIGLRRARYCFSGAAPISPELLTFFRILGVPLREVYGMTETCGIALGQQSETSPVGSIGLPIPGLEARIAPDGALLMRGAQIFAGYYKHPEATAEALQNGWLDSGDMAEMLGDEFRIVDRKKDIIITAGGKNISPSEVENALKSSPYIREAIVIGEGRPYVSALIQIDYETVGKWAESKSLAYTTYRSLAQNPAVRELIEKEVQRVCTPMPRVQQVRRFHLLAKELDHDDGEVTATMKVRRSAIHKAFAAEVEALYAAEEKKHTEQA
ncbi:MAG: AMP-binding protein [Pararhodobacter sp.]|nr:AMP-binding protein [Pararhodobacter sp.]